ncbi:MAG: biopolymer transporter ExbD [Anaerovibrio sp.]|uniref:ExbD/TolR family protein n=1 Tax=Anaerovibrio sp. TaxID=1872532 RepID=UPI0025C19DA3|nr:biopolymer transporter ExbD [Anaerovibrio sp.]MBE6098498.1 biopolymer transporter ExbD [Anaerovibrio sp.]
MKIDLTLHEEKPRLMIIPMIDIIFFLLVFFMMSMLTMVVQKSMPLNLPQATSSKVSMEENIPITVTQDGTVYYEKEKISLGDLENRLWTKKQSGELSIILRGDAAADYGKVVQVMDMIKNLGISKVYIATDTQG